MEARHGTGGNNGTMPVRQDKQEKRKKEKLPKQEMNGTSHNPV
jgi:hypothetical protein